MDKDERENYFINLETELLRGGANFSEWCTFISKSVYDAFVNGADLATVITAMACIETYYKTEFPEHKNKSLAYLIDTVDFLDEGERRQLHVLRRYRNRWVHSEILDDSAILLDDTKFFVEAEEMAKLSVKLLLTVLFSNPFI